MIGAVAELTVKEGTQEEFEKAASELEAAVNANEPGRSEFDMSSVEAMIRAVEDLVAKAA